jgi:ribose transport system substrate-binding protein
VGFDGNQDLRDFVKSGTLQATAVQDSYGMGAQGVNTLLQIIGGKKVPARVNTGVVVVTRQNIDQPETARVLY